MHSDIIYTPEQEKAMTELRERLKDILLPDISEDFHYFYRFLKARNFNMEQAESMLRKHIEYAKSMQFDTLLEDYDPPEVVKKYLSSNFIGFDKEGSIVRIFHLGNADSKGLFKSTNKIHLVKNTLQYIQKDFQRIRQQNKKYNKTWLPTMLILDCDNLTLAKVTDKASIENFVTEVMNFQNNFPETLKSVYIINASSYFTMAFPIFKAILVGPIIAKIKVFGKDGWKEEFLKYVDAEVLPVCYGGTRTDPDGNPFCETQFTWGGKVPEHYYKNKDVEKFASQPGVKQITLPRMSCFEVRVEVKNFKTTLEWEFEVKSSDVGIKIVLEESSSKNEEPEEIVPLHLLQTEVEPLSGKLRCKKPGTYIIVFSNKHSWFQAKEVYYRTWLTPPDIENECEDK